MLILTIRTDKPEAEIGLYDGQDDGPTRLAYETWQAHRALAVSIHSQIAALLEQADKDLGNLQGIVAFAGPGSFTGLRIGLTVANALAYSYDIAVTGAQGDDWLAEGISRLLQGEGGRLTFPVYGAEPNITMPCV